LSGRTRHRTPGAPGVRAALAGLPGYCRVLVVGVAVNRLASFVELFLVLYLISQGNSAKAAGLALTTFGLGTVLGLLSSGVLVERLGTRVAIVFSMVSAGSTTALLPFIHGPAAVAALSAAIGAATQIFRPAARSLLAAATAPGDLVLVMAGYRFGFNVGAMLTPLLGAALAAWSWTAVFTMDAAASLLFAAVAFWVLPRDRRRPTRPDHKPGRGAARPLRDRRFVLVVIGLFLVAAVEVQYVATLPLELHRQGMPAIVYSALVALNGGLVIAVEPALTTKLRGWPLRRSLSLGIALIGMGVAGYGLPGGIAILVIATVLWTTGEMLGGPAAAAYPALAAPPSAPARYVGLAAGAQGAGYAVGPLLGVGVYSGSPALCWLLCAVAGLIAGALAWRGCSQRSPSDRATPSRAPSHEEALPAPANAVPANPR
jgi:predicted MFS family arabinose efflux permease